MSVRMPHHIDLPPMFFIFDMDEIIIFFSLFSVGILIEKTLLFSIIALVSTRYYSRQKGAMNRGLLKHIGYWHGLFNLKGPYGNGLDRHFGG